MKISQQKSHFVKFTQQEHLYYSQIFDKLDAEKKGKVSALKVGQFLIETRLNDETLRKIFIVAKRKDTKFIEKGELYILFRLVALAQNNMPYTIDSLIRNNPMPPLPKFYPKKVLTKSEDNEINKSDIDIYQKIFFENKDTKKDYMTQIKVITLLQKLNYGNSIEIHNAIEKLQPFEIQGFFNVKEFVVICHLLYKNKNSQNSNINLPPYVLDYLGRNQKEIIKNENNNSEISLYNKVLIENKININLKRTKALNKKYELLNKKIKELYEEIGKLEKEIEDITRELTILKDEKNHLHLKLNKVNNEGYCFIKNNSNSIPKSSINNNIISKIKPNNIEDNNSYSLYNFTKILNNAYEKVKKFETYQSEISRPNETNINSKIFESKETNNNNCLDNVSMVDSSAIEFNSSKK